MKSEQPSKCKMPLRRSKSLFGTNENDDDDKEEGTEPEDQG